MKLPAQPAPPKTSRRCNNRNCPRSRGKCIVSASGRVLGCACIAGRFGKTCKQQRRGTVRICRPNGPNAFTADTASRKSLSILRNRNVRLPGDTFDKLTKILGPNCQVVTLPRRRASGGGGSGRCSRQSCSPSRGKCIRNSKGRQLGWACRAGFFGKPCRIGRTS